MNKALTIAIIYLFCGLTHWVFSQEMEQKKDTLLSANELTYDSAPIKPLKAAENLNEKYSGKEFYYEQNIVEGANFIERFFTWLFRKLNDIFGINISPGLQEILKYLVYLILTVFAIWLLVKLLTNQSPKQLFQTKKQNLGEVYLEDENIEDVDFKKYIKQALKDKNYRLAVRYVYLDALKSLSQKGWIKWHNDKTNIEYLMEIKNPTVKKDFEQISYVYDNVWYGEYSIDKEDFNIINNKYRQLERQL